MPAATFLDLDRSAYCGEKFPVVASLESWSRAPCSGAARNWDHRLEKLWAWCRARADELRLWLAIVPLDRPWSGAQCARSQHGYHSESDRQSRLLHPGHARCVRVSIRRCEN